MLVLPRVVLLGLRTRKGKSHAVFLFAHLTSYSKGKFEDGDTSSGVDGGEMEDRGCFNLRVLDRRSCFNAARCSGDPCNGEDAKTPALPSPGAFNISPGATSVSLPQCLMMAGSKLRVCRSFLLETAFDAGEEHEKTLFSIP